MRKVPSVMVSQHPDNANKPFWHTDAYIRDHDEVKECYLAFSTLGVSEYKWDWEGKFVDESVFERLISEYPSFFHKNQLGKDKFLTFRLPDFRVNTEFRFGRALMGIISAAGLAHEIGFHSPPIFEVILPMTTNAEEMIAVQEAFKELSNLQHPLNTKSNSIKHIEIIPLFEDVRKIIESSEILEDYLQLHERVFNFKPSHIRPYFARSDSALSSGLVSSVLAIKIALSRYARFSDKNRVKLLPIIGAGSLPFRGGSTPYTYPKFLKEYSGIRTMLVQSAYQYDFPRKDVLKSIEKINRILPKTAPLLIDSKEERKIEKIVFEFEPFYKQTVKRIGQMVYNIAIYMPPRRERLRHTGLLKYPRVIEGVKIPRAINFTASLYSIGIPPEFIGIGRALKEASKNKSLGTIEKYYFGLKEDLTMAGRFLNKKVLSSLTKKSSVWSGIQEDVLLVEKYLKEEVGPISPEEKAHQVFTESIYDRFSKGIEMTDLIEEAAVLRRSLG